MRGVQNAVVDDRDDLPFMVHSKLDDLDLTPYEFRVYAHLLRRAGRPSAGALWESVPNGAKHCRMDAKTYRAALRSLTQRNLIQAEERSGQTTVYRLTSPRDWRPLPDTAPLPDKAGVTPTGYGRPPLPDAAGVPLPDTVDKGSPLEGSPSKVLRTKNTSEIEVKRREIKSPNGDARLSPAGLLQTYNENRGSLPEALTLSPKRKTALGAMIKRYGERAETILRAATLTVATDTFWIERGYGLDNLLAGEKYVAKAEVWQQNGMVGGTRNRAAAVKRAGLAKLLQEQDERAK